MFDVDFIFNSKVFFLVFFHAEGFYNKEITYRRVDEFYGAETQTDCFLMKKFFLSNYSEVSLW